MIRTNLRQPPVHINTYRRGRALGYSGKSRHFVFNLKLQLLIKQGRLQSDFSFTQIEAHDSLAAEPRISRQLHLRSRAKQVYCGHGESIGAHISSRLMQLSIKTLA